MAEYQYVSQGMDDGVVMGFSDSKVSFYGVTPVVQQTITTTNVVTAGSTTTICNNAVTEIQIALGKLGLTCTNQ
jgi:hypothetical protein